MHSNLEAEVKLIPQHTFFIGPIPFSKNKIMSAFTDYKNLFINHRIQKQAIIAFINLYKFINF
jgi:hypothetical protein